MVESQGDRQTKTDRQTNTVVGTLPASSDDQFGRVNSSVEVKWPVIDDVWIVTIGCKLLAIDVQMSLT